LSIVTSGTHRVVQCIMCETAAQEHNAGREEEKLIPSLTHLHHKLHDLLQSTEAVLRKEGDRERGREGRGGE